MSTVGSNRSVSVMSKESVASTESRTTAKTSTSTKSNALKSVRSTKSPHSASQLVDYDKEDFERASPISIGFEDTLEIISEEGITASNALFTKLRNSVFLDFSEEKNRVRFRNQFLNHVRDVYKK